MAIRKDLMSPHIWENRKNTVKNLYYYVLKSVSLEKLIIKEEIEREGSRQTLSEILTHPM
jgi:hypothetical protein